MLFLAPKKTFPNRIAVWQETAANSSCPPYLVELNMEKKKEQKKEKTEQKTDRRILGQNEKRNAERQT